MAAARTALRLVFMGTPDFAVPALEALIDAGHDIVCVYSRPPRPAGRGHRERRSPVHACAHRHGIEVRTPASLRDAEAQTAFAALGADAAVVAAYGLILPAPVLEAPRHGCLNIHASLLPRWRGAAPIHRALLAGDAETGITVMQMDEGLDTGPMLLREKIDIAADATAETLHDALAEIGARLIVEALDGIAAGTLQAVPQPEDGATYAPKLARDEGRLDWTEPADALARRVRALNPWPGTWFEHPAEKRGERIRVLDACAAGGSGAPGTVIEAPLTVACGTGALRIERVQRAGKAPMAAEDFARGYALPPGTQLA